MRKIKFVPCKCGGEKWFSSKKCSKCHGKGKGNGISTLKGINNDDTQGGFLKVRLILT